MGVNCDYSGAFDSLYETYERRAGDDLRRRAERDHLSWISDPEQVRGNSSTQVTGRSRLALLRKTLDSFVLGGKAIKRSKNQRMFHREMMCAIMKQLFRDDLSLELDDLLTEFKKKTFKSEMMVVTPRRWGKTFSVAMFVAACAVALENTEQAIFSTGRRASQKLLELVYRFLTSIPGMKESIIKYNVETIWIKGPCGPDDIRKIFSYPSKVSTLKVSWVVVTGGSFVF